MDRLAALGESDGEVRCWHDGAAFRFSSKTTVGSGEAKTLMVLLRLDDPGSCVAGLLLAGPQPSLPSDLGDAGRAQARADRAARRGLAAALFRRAEEVLATGRSPQGDVRLSA
ncbi:MAG TPA: hypothetical protein VMH50_08125 [Thermoleophilia bacterium]|nr:hypothetical protein [Thermoleophilia bacterium]